MAGSAEPHFREMSSLLHAQAFFRRVDEFDVLRAIAVTGVVASHVGGLSGGFLGVDIFFVISGYVITLLLLNQSASGRFSFRDFYYRRAVRIIPPLLVVSVVIYLFSWFVFYLPEDSDFIRESFYFQSFFVQNFYFVVRAADYFQGLMTAKLNLHTWSLAVEEQFYLVYPLLFFVFYRFRRARWVPWTVGIAFVIALFFLTNAYERYLVSPLGFLLGMDFSGQALRGTRYYLIFPRIWELLLGSLTCLLVYRFHLKGKTEQIHISVTLAQSAVIAGLGVLAFSIILVAETMAWPRMVALLPMAATAGLLGLFHLYGVACLPSVLNLRPLHVVGKCSYSLYLWHWPVLGMLIYTNSDFGVSWIDYAIYFVFVALLTAGTYLFIEQPRHRMRPRHAWIVLVAFMSFSFFASQLKRSQDGFPVEIRTILETGAYAERCERCTEVPTQRFFVLWGDSHSQMLVQTAARAAAHAGFQLVHIKGSLADNRKRLLDLAGSPLFAGAVMASRWSMYAVGFPVDEPEEAGTRYLPVDGKPAKDPKEAGDHFQYHLRRFLADMNGKPVLLLLEVPRYPFFPKKELIMDWAGLKLRQLPVKTIAEHRNEQQETRKMIQSIAAEYPAVRLADPAEILCADGTCAWRNGWKLLYKDDDHLSVYGSERLETVFKKYFVDAGGSR